MHGLLSLNVVDRIKTKIAVSKKYQRFLMRMIAYIIDILVLYIHNVWSLQLYMAMSVLLCFLFCILKTNAIILTFMPISC